jgi:hypothetical protein
MGGGMFVVFVIGAMLMAGVGRMARDRGRSVLVWAFGAAAAGVAGFALGVAVMQQFVDDEVGDLMMVLSMMAPAGFMVMAMIGVWGYLYRSPVQVSQKNEWKVHFVSRGEGQIVISGGEVRFEWEGGSRTEWLDRLERVEPDGECVRIQVGDLELAVLPMGGPDSPDARRRQSLVLARRLKTTVRATGI